MSSQTVLTKLQGIAEQAVRDPKRVFTTLAHLIDVDFLKEAFNRTRKDAAPGVDGVTAEEYANNLDGKISGSVRDHRKYVSNSVEDDTESP